MTATLSEREAFVRAIIAAPDDDLPRLVFADWLDEHGEGELAEFIRVQCRLAHPFASCTPRCSHEYGHLLPCEFGLRDGLRRRERELLIANMADWLLPSPTRFPVVTESIDQHGWGLREKTGLGHEYLPVRFRRGFVDEVHGRLKVLIGGECELCAGTGMGRHKLDICPDCSGTGRTLGILAAALKSHPVTRVVCGDRDPQPRAFAGWIRQSSDPERTSPDCLPDDVYDRLTGGTEEWDAVQWTRYPTREAALAALSTALIRWAIGD